ncbi:MAG TPA: hypothetical protein VMH22_00680 [bacterium]|nr:hypothetical protein [bacterium]
MKNQLEADREFFLEVIDDLTKDAAQHAHKAEMTSEQFWDHIQRQAAEFDRMFPEAAQEPEVATEDKDEAVKRETEEEAAERFRQALARVHLKELLFFRRHQAKLICMRVTRVGSSDITPCAQMLKGSLERLQAADAEIRRRMQARTPNPPDHQ